MKMLVPIKCCNMNNYLTTSAIPVTVSLNGNKDREYKGLYEALTRYGLDEGLILTVDKEFEDSFKDKKIILMPVWKWLLQ